MTVTRAFGIPWDDTDAKCNKPVNNNIFKEMCVCSYECGVCAYVVPGVSVRVVVNVNWCICE